jgi:hypothetical protein
MKKLFVILPIVAVLSACGSFKYNTGVELENGSGKRMFTNEVNYPNWYAESHKKDDQALYSVGTEYSKDFQFSVDKSMLSAKRELAANFSSHLSAMMKDYATEAGIKNSDITHADIERTTKLIVARVNLIGVQRSQFKVVHENNGYRTFVQLRYSLDESNRMMLAEIQRNQALYVKLRAARSFKELEREVDKIEKVEAEKSARVQE